MASSTLVTDTEDAYSPIAAVVSRDYCSWCTLRTRAWRHHRPDCLPSSSEPAPDASGANVETGSRFLALATPEYICHFVTTLLSDAGTLCPSRSRCRCNSRYLAGEKYFERAAERLSLHYGLPVAVHGAIVVAVGPSFPEISSIVISTVLHGDFSLGVGAIVGSALFNLLVIPALSAFSSRELESTRDIVHTDAQFYLISVLVLFIVSPSVRPTSLAARTVLRL